MYLEYDKINIDNMMIFKCHGELDIYHSLDFKEEIKKEIKDDYFDILVLDFSDIRHIDSSGIGSLVSVFKFINENRIKRIKTWISNFQSYDEFQDVIFYKDPCRCTCNKSYK